MSAQVNFIRTELATGLTLTSRMEEEGSTRERSRALAREAYDSALRFVGRVTLTQDESHDIREKLQFLRNRLEALGEIFLP